MRILLLVFLLPTLCIADDYLWEDKCDRDQRSMNICAGEMFRFYDKELNRLYTIQMEHLQTKSRKKYFKDAQVAWVAFRDKDCLYSVGKREDSGSIWPAAHKSCLAEKTKKRVVELKRYVMCRDNGCPY